MFLTYDSHLLNLLRFRWDSLFSCLNLENYIREVREEEILLLYVDVFLKPYHYRFTVLNLYFRHIILLVKTTCLYFLLNSFVMYGIPDML